MDSNIYEWKCTVCGEIIKSADIPEKCPVCGMDSNYFIKLKKNDVSFASVQYEKIVIIGASAAGIAAIEEIRKRNKVCDITIISKEPVYGYYRPQLSKIFGHDIEYELLFIKDYDWFRENKIEVLLGKNVVEIRSREKAVLLDTGLIKEYDKLIIASGAECFMPNIAGNNKNGVFTLRYLKDVEHIKEYAQHVKKVSVVGGGVLGLETAWELKKLGLDVSVIELADRILPRQLDERASKMLETIMKDNGINLVLGNSVTEITGEDMVSGLKLKSGDIMQAELVVVSAGVRANSKIAEETGIMVNKAIIVNDKMRTNANDVYACGDCCEYNGINYALWSEAVEQGKIAGINVSGDSAVYSPIIPSTTTNIFNTSIFSVGDIGSNPNEQYTAKEKIDEENNAYEKLFYKNDMLSGAILIGDTKNSKNLLEEIEKTN